LENEYKHAGMSKFGELIDSKHPVLLDFYAEWNEQSNAMHPVLRDVAAALGDKCKVIKIDVDKNNELSQALRVKGLPTLIIYKNGEMVWRQSGEQDANTLIGILNEYM
jgi:thioredoxin 1